jgi:hypothetical protein
MDFLRLSVMTIAGMFLTQKRVYSVTSVKINIMIANCASEGINTNGRYRTRTCDLTGVIRAL